MNKLDYLAQKEEELRQLNEKLEERMKNAFNIEEERPPTSSKQAKLDDSLDGGADDDDKHALNLD